MRSIKHGFFAGLVVVLSLCCTAQTLKAQSTPPQLRETYLTPPDNIASQVLAPRYKNILLSNVGPKRTSVVNYIKEENFTPIKQYAKFFYNLGGLEIDPKANRKRTLTNQMPGYRKAGSGSGLLITNPQNGKTLKIRAPDGAHISNVTWSPKGSKLAYFANFKDATYIYVADTKTGRSRQVTEQPVLATLNTSFDWSGDGKYIFTVLVPADRGDEPRKPAVNGPQVRMSTTKDNRLRTFGYLLENPYQIKLLKYYITGQFARINVDNQEVREIGEPAIIRNINVSPNGKYAMVTVLQTPFSYIVPMSSFGWTQQVWDLSGKSLVTLQKSEIRKGIPDHKTVKDHGRSDIKWRPDGQGLSLIVGPPDDEDNKDHDDSDEEVEQKDKKPKTYRLVQWMPPFSKGDQKVIYTSKKKMQSVSYGEDSDVLFIQDRSSGKRHLYAVYPDHAKKTYTIYKYDRDAFYKNPGTLLYKTAQTGLPVVQLSPDKKSVFLSGTQHYKDPQEKAPRPFIDRVDIRSDTKKRVFQSPDDAYEQVAAVLDDEINKIIVTRETPTGYPDSWLLKLDSGEKTKLTSNSDYNKAITNAQRKRFKVKRPDGFEFWVTVVLPEHWDGKPLPGLVWHYPTEYDDQKDYDNSTRGYNKNQFPSINHGWPERAEQMLIQAGYAVVKADWPIYSKRGGPNDAFVYSVRQNSTAIVDSVASKGYVDRDRVAIGGHSYGGFGTINALVHTSIFKAGIAGDANSNRLLTPLGFQREPRDLWRGRSRYLQMSPILWANRLDGALLMYSGADDQNVGTAPFMSWQFFHALNALGKPTALYMYPYAQHHTNAKEIVLDRWARWVNWLDHYVKEKGKPVPETELGK